MNIKYFQDTDTLFLNFNDNEIYETKDINENLLVELDKKGNIVSMTLEHAKNYANINDLSYQRLAAV
ncbi:MAG: DUF2283 domain-containing protein [bacterium]